MGEARGYIVTDFHTMFITMTMHCQWAWWEKTMQQVRWHAHVTKVEHKIGLFMSDSYIINTFYVFLPLSSMNGVRSEAKLILNI